MIRKIIKRVLGQDQRSAKKPSAAGAASAAPAPKKTPARSEAAAGAGGSAAAKPGAAAKGAGAPARRRGRKTRREGEGASAPRRRPKEDVSGGAPRRGRSTGGRDGRRGRKRPAAEGRRDGRSRGRPGRAEPGPLPELPPLPPWSPPDDPGRFSAYDLPREVQRGIRKAGFTECTTIQAKALPLSLAGTDVAAQSQTGTGKTAAFLITIFSRLLRRGPVSYPGPRALIIAPTRELVVQIEGDAELLGEGTGLTRAVAFGGVDYDRQRRALQKGPDILVGTPGRLIDYLKQGVWRPEGVEVLVIDEADRMFDMGFIRDLRFILRRLPPYERRQSMLFSATLNWRVMELTYEYMNLPVQISASPEKVTAERAEELLYHVERKEKPSLFLGLLKKEPWERALIFTNMKVEAEKVARLLVHHGYPAQAITGNLEQKRRLKLMEEFKAGKLPLLVATDVASRGLHVEGITHVFNWDLPQDPEDYVHRIGRTARAGEVGTAISLADEETVYHLEPIEKLIGYKIPVKWHGAEDLAPVTRGWERRPRAERERDRRGARSGRSGHSGRSSGRPDGGRRGGSAGGRRRR